MGIMLPYGIGFLRDDMLDDLSAKPKGQVFWQCYCPAATAMFPNTPHDSKNRAHERQ
jgi:hypothetical protein